MCGLLALLALAVVSSSGHFVLPTPTSPITTCGVATVGSEFLFPFPEPNSFSGSINNVCPTGCTVISGRECCLASRVTSSSGTFLPSTTPTPRPPFSCVDTPNVNGVNECPGWRIYCNDDFYKGYMTQHCPQTCGLCAPTTPRFPGFPRFPPRIRRCSDESSDCAANAGLCNNPIIKEFMKSQCQKTCGYCR